MAKSQNYSRTIGVFFGSRSAEHDQSIATATMVARELVTMGFNVAAIYLDPEGGWHISPIINSLQKDIAAQINDLTNSLSSAKWALRLDHTGPMVFSAPKRFGRQELPVDIAFPVFHGLSGEDGTFQGLCDLLRIPYIGSGLATSALGLDKVLAKDVLQSFGISTKPYVYFTQIEWQEHRQDLIAAIDADINLPAFVKPARLGGAIGINRIETIDELTEAVEAAFSFDTKVLIEEAVANPIEIIVSVLGNYFRPDHIQVSNPLYRNPKNSRFETISIPQSDTEDIKDLANEVFSVFEATGLAQIDIIKDSKTGKLYVTEIDTIPYDLSLPVWQASGVAPDAVLRELVRLADENFARN